VRGDISDWKFYMSNYCQNNTLNCKTNEAQEIAKELLILTAILLDALEDARADIAVWAAYASKYFQEKHDLKGNLAYYDGIIKKSHDALKKLAD
jgi:hypothetical protein